MKRLPAQCFGTSEAGLYVAHTMEKDEMTEILTSQGSHHKTKIGYRTAVADRWPRADYEAWQPGDTVDVGGFIKRVIYEAEPYFDLPRTQDLSLIAVWTIGTYVYQLFNSYPRLNFLGEMGSGKSKFLRLISTVAFNGECFLSPTPATLFRLIEDYRGTLCLDEMEKLHGPDSKQLNDILNAGYTRGVQVPRAEADGKGGFRVVTFDVYAPLAFASIQGVPDVLASRSLTVHVLKGQQRDKINSDIDVLDPQWGELRALGYRMALGNFQEIRARRRETDRDLPVWLNARPRQLYAPLLALASFYPPAYEHILELARREAHTSSSGSEDGEALIQCLEVRLNTQLAESAIEVTPKGIAEALSDRLGRPQHQPVTPEQAGQLLRRYGFKGRRTKRDMRYTIPRDMVQLIRERYFPVDEGEPERPRPVCRVRSTGDPDLDALLNAPVEDVEGVG